ncbi:hypothetical protein B0H14DRAFT_2634139 [Mycena olivaceomarginata]|nr:hypothetical protein B0H14DRAFT_2634139 [Mycena olivaceomarginata]
MARAPAKRTSQRILRRGQGQPRVVGSTFEPVAASADTVSSPSASVPPEIPRRKTPNQFMCFRSWVQTEGPLRNTNSQSNLSEMAAYLWRGMTPEAKRPFLKQAKALSTASRQAGSGPSPNTPSQKNSTASAPGKANTRTKNRQPKDSGSAHKLQTPPASSYYRMAPDRIQPQFAGAERAKPIFTPPHQASSSSSTYYYPSLDMSVGRDTNPTEDTDCSFNPHSVFDYLEEMEEENRKQCQAEDEMMKEYLNLDEFED